MPRPPGSTDGFERSTVVGGLVALGGLGALTLVLLPFRPHLSVAIPALVFIVPVILGVVIGGFVPGVVGALAGFLLYDLYFLPPFGRLTVQAPGNWVALLVYVLVVMVVARVVSNLKAAREQAARREQDTARLFELSRALIGDLNLAQLLEHIVGSVQAAFHPRWTALLLPAVDGDGLAVTASAGEGLSDADIDSVTASSGEIRSLGMMGDAPPRRAAVALVASNRPVGLLVLQDVQFAHQDRSMLGAFANQAALAVERAQLREQVLRTRLLEEVDGWRRSMMGAVSHDLRTPLSSIKTAVSSLRQSGSGLAEGDRSELLELIELQSDRLSRLVTNLLDMTRIESGALEVRRTTIAFDELVEGSLNAVQELIPRGRVQIDAPDDLPLLDIDHVLAGQVLINLLENAARIAPAGSAIRISAARAQEAGSTLVEIAVTDEGPGIAPSERERVFEMFSRLSGGGRAGLGLAIAKAFVEAHGGRIWVDPQVHHGARVVFTLPSESDVVSYV
jgi:two-component system sensor histidine kinase KdpD